MENAVWSVIKYTPKNGCSDEFKKALESLADIMNKPDITWSLIELDTGEIVQISRIPGKRPSGGRSPVQSVRFMGEKAN